MSVTTKLAGPALAAALVALGGCATEVAQQPYHDAYAASEYAGTRHLYKHDRVAPLTPPMQFVGEYDQPLEARSYAGIEGAKRAHDIYPTEIAEKLDGQCGPQEKISSGIASLAEVADYCDVSLAKLVAHNPRLNNVFGLGDGLMVKIPGAAGIETGGGLASMTGAAATLYTVDEEQTLSDVAYKLNVSTASLIQLNPKAKWGGLKAGDVLRTPAVSAPMQWST